MRAALTVVGALAEAAEEVHQRRALASGTVSTMTRSFAFLTMIVAFAGCGNSTGIGDPAPAVVVPSITLSGAITGSFTTGFIAIFDSPAAHGETDIDLVTQNPGLGISNFSVVAIFMGMPQAKTYGSSNSTIEGSISMMSGDYFFGQSAVTTITVTSASVLSATANGTLYTVHGTAAGSMTGTGGDAGMGTVMFLATF